MKKALLVEDNFEDIKEIIEVLKSDFELCIEKDIDAAWSKIEDSSDFDVFILDYWIGDKTGLELTRKIRSIDGYKKHPILIYSSESDPEIRTKARNLNAFWLVKPINPVPFKSVIEKMIAAK